MENKGDMMAETLQSKFLSLLKSHHLTADREIFEANPILGNNYIDGYVRAYLLSVKHPQIRTASDFTNLFFECWDEMFKNPKTRAANKAALDSELQWVLNQLNNPRPAARQSYKHI